MLGPGANRRGAQATPRAGDRGRAVPGCDAAGRGGIVCPQAPRAAVEPDHRMMTARALGPATLALIAGLLAGHPAGAQQPAQPQQPPTREVTVQNETDLTLRELYLAQPGAADRGPDRLGADVVAPGATLRLRLGRTRDCLFDVTAIYQGGSEEQRRRVDICRAPRLVFGDPTMPTLEAAVANRSQVVLRELYVVRAGGDAAARDAAGWGPDRLGAAVINPGAGFALRLRTRDCTFDLRAVYADDQVELRTGVELCQARGIAFDRSAIPRAPARRIVLANRHLAPVQGVYLSPVTEHDWGPERLGGAPLPAGEDTTVEMEGGCEADLRILFANGAAEERRALDVCQMTRIVLRPGWVVAEALDEEGPVVALPAEPLTGLVRLRNAGRLPIVEIYTGPPGGARGEDRLGADTLPVGATIEIEPADPDACEADLIAVFRDGREVVQPGLDLCSGEEIELQ